MIKTNDQSIPKQIGKLSEKSCTFCDKGIRPTYTDSAALRRFMSARGKIVPRQRSGVCSKHQRALAREIKRARDLALLPFTLRV